MSRPEEPHQPSHTNTFQNPIPQSFYQNFKKLASDSQIFPPSFAHLLDNQSKNVRQFKNKLKTDKSKIDEDLFIFKNQIFNILDDLRLSLHAHLDKIYQGYLEKYSGFKAQLQEVVHLKNKITHYHPHQSRVQTKQPNKRYNTTISEMEAGNESFKQHQTIQLVSQMQKQKVPDLVRQQKQITILSQYDNGFYQTQQFCYILNRIRSRFTQEIGGIYSGEVHSFIRNIDAIFPSFEKEKPISNQDKSYNGTPYNPHRYNEIEKYGSPLPNRIINNYKIQPPIVGLVSQNLQTVRVQWAESINLAVQHKLNIGQNSPLSCLSIHNQLVFGCKGGGIQILSEDGLNIATLKHHRASICCLSTVEIRNQLYLVSGSDHPCNSVIIWEPSSWKPLDKYDNHKAAISSLIDLKDSCHLMSTGYDKVINVYNLEEGKLRFTLGEQMPIIGGVLNKSGTRVCTANLNKQLVIWHLIRNNQGKVQSMFLEKRVNIETLACSLVPSFLSSQLLLVAGKDGKLRMINMDLGQITDKLSCCNGHIVEIVLIERQSKPNKPLAIIFEFKSRQIIVINTQNGLQKRYSWPGYLEYCCGVGPKCYLMQRGSKLGIVSHNSNDFYWCRLEEGQ